MSVRSTSLEAYQSIRENGLLSKKRWEVYDYLFKHGPLSQQDTCRGMRQSPHIITPRFAELKKLGVIEECGKKIDEYSNQTVYLWRTTDRLPKKYDKDLLKTYFILFTRTQECLVFKTKAKANEYKLKNKIVGVIHEGKEIR